QSARLGAHFFLPTTLPRDATLVIDIAGGLALAVAVAVGAFVCARRSPSRLGLLAGPLLLAGLLAPLRLYPFTGYGGAGRLLLFAVAGLLLLAAAGLVFLARRLIVAGRPAVAAGALGLVLLPAAFVDVRLMSDPTSVELRPAPVQQMRPLVAELLRPRLR